MLFSHVLPAVSVRGTAPTFFKIPLTPDLVQAVVTGEPPTRDTVLDVFEPRLPHPSETSAEAMWPLENRRAVLQCFEVLKKFV